MRRYDLLARLDPIVCDILKDAPYGERITIGYIMPRLDPGLTEGDDPSEITETIERILGKETGDCGYLIADENGYRRRDPTEYAGLVEMEARIKEKDKEWRYGCILFAILTAAWLICRIWGEGWGMRVIIVPFFGLPLTFQDMIWLSALTMLVWYRIIQRSTE